MSELDAQAEPNKQPLRFDTADFSSAESLAQELSCATCRRPLVATYFEVGRQKMCPVCKDAVIAFRTGSGVAAFFRAWLYGAIAGILGSGLYFAVLAISGIHLGLIAIVVGIMVGIAVRKGSRYRGGWLYQAMAMFITYGSIVTSFVPEIVSSIRQSGHLDTQNPLVMSIVIVVAWIMAWLSPIIGLPGILILDVIIGFGVYEAWKLNKRVPLTITGPYFVSAGSVIDVRPQDFLEPPPAPDS